MIETLKLLGYVYCGRLASDRDVAKRLSDIASKEMGKLPEINNWCLQNGRNCASRLPCANVGNLKKDSLEDWLNVAAYCKKVLSPEETRMLGRMTEGGRIDPALHPENEKWLAHAKMPKRLVDLWLGSWCHPDEDPENGRVRFFLAEEIQEQFQMGNWYGSCLRLVEDGGNGKLIGLITDVNKRILLCKSDRYGLIGRRTVGIDASGLHVQPAYPRCHDTVRKLLSKGASLLKKDLERAGLNEVGERAELSPCGITAPAYAGEWEPYKVSQY